MSVNVPNYRWSVEEFLLAWEAGVFEHRVELVEGEVWPVVIGDWHGKTVGRVIRLLGFAGHDATTSTLPSGGSLPDPDCWVSRPGAVRLGALGRRLSTWDPADVVLVVEVSDETLMADLTRKARIYGAAGWPVYWVVSEDVVYVHTEPHPAGYRRRIEYRAGERLSVPGIDATLGVDEILGIG